MSGPAAVGAPEAARAEERATVLRGTGGVWHVRTATGAEHEAALRGRLKHLAETPKLAVGDEVTIAREPGAGATLWTITDILPRRSQLVRRAPGAKQTSRVVAANVDQVVIVFAAARPEPHPRMLDRFLVIAEANALPARIVINKVDLVGEAAARERFRDYERAGYPVHCTSVVAREGIDALHEALVGRTSVLTGPSGVGKSSLLNTVYPGLALRVGAISESVNKGRHTTVGASLHPLPGAGEGYVVDTPGLREVGLWGVPSAELDRCFPEFRPHLGQCRFADCTHRVEPGCAVLEAVARGEIGAERYESYRKLREELEEAERVW